MSLITLTIRQCQLCKSLNGQWRYVPWLALDHWKGSLLQNRASVDVIRPAATFHSSDATVVIGRRLSYPCPSRALFYNYAPLLPASSYFNSYLHRHVLLYHHVVIMEGILYEYIIVTFFPRAYFGANMVLLAGSSAPKSCPWENLALQYSIF